MKPAPKAEIIKLSPFLNLFLKSHITSGIDVPAVEGFHKRLLGGYDIVKAAFPEIPENNYLFLDTVNGLVDNVVAKFSSAYQSMAANTDYWIILGGDEGAHVVAAIVGLDHVRRVGV